MNKKEIMLRLVHDVPSLIKIQKYTLQELKKSRLPANVVDVQEDILKVLEAVNKMGIINLDKN